MFFCDKFFANLFLVLASLVPLFWSSPMQRHIPDYLVGKIWDFSESQSVGYAPLMDCKGTADRPREVIYNKYIKIFYSTNFCISD